MRAGRTLLLALIAVCGCAPSPSPIVENASVLPTFELTDAAYQRCVALLARESDPRAILMLSKGNMSVERSGTVVEQHSGWMITAVNREQFPNSAIVKTRGVEILVDQPQYYSELKRSTIDYRDGWWTFMPAI